jgi:hypothetical protein
MASENVIDRRHGAAVAVGDVVIEPIERIVVRVEQLGSGIVGLALKEPSSVVVRSLTGIFRFDLEDTELTTGDTSPTAD